jgi:hypothetical protein
VTHSRICCGFFAALLVATASGVRAQVAVDALVVDAAGVPVASADVSLRSLPDSVVVHAATTDSVGRTSFSGVLPGRYALVVERLGFQRAVRGIDVGSSAPARFTVTLAESAVDLPRVLVEAERRRARFDDNVGATLAELTQRDLKLLPALGEADVLRAIEVLPGVVSTSDFSSAFNVRGGAADQNLILLDGLPIYNPFHLGGLFSVFNGDMVGRAELLAGGFPARYGGRVSSVLNVETDPGEPGFSVEGGLSLLATRVAIGTDISPAAIADFGLRSARARLSLRRSYFDQLLKPFFDFPYHLTDVQLHGDAWTHGGARITVTGYTGRDVLDLAGVEDFPLQVRWHWGNDVAGVSWERPLGAGRTLAVRTGHSRFSTGIRFPEFADTEFQSRIDQSLLRAELTVPVSPGSVSGGIGIDRLAYNNFVASGGTVFREGADQGWLLSGFTQTRLERGAWQAELGARVDAWLPGSSDAITVFAPRIALRRFIRGRDVAVKVAAGRYSQFAQSLRDEELPLGIDIWVLAGERAPHVVSDQVQLGVEGFVLPGWYAAIETYYRRFEGVVTNNVAEDPNDPTDDMLRGVGASYGGDLHIRRDRGRIRPMLAVSWLKSWRDFPDVLSGLDPPEIERYAPIFDRRVDIDFVMQALLPRNFELGVRWNYGSGLPYTRPLGGYLYYDYSLRTGLRRPGVPGIEDLDLAVVLGRRNAERYPAYDRLDVGIRRTYRKSWGELTPYLDILNVLNRRNVLFYFYQYDRTPPTRSGLSMFPLLPTVGVEVSF